MPNLNTNLTTTATLSPTMQTFYDKNMLQYAKDTLAYDQAATKKSLPANSGKTIQFRRWVPFNALTAPLTEGTPPDGQTLSQNELFATIAQYGGYVTVSDLLDMTALDPVIAGATRLLGEQAGLSLDTLIRDQLATGTNVIYANGKTSRSQLAANTDRISTEDFARARRFLKKQKAPEIRRGNRGHYMAFLSPDTEYDIFKDEMWRDVSKYQDSSKLYNGEIGTWYNIICVMTTNPTVFTGAGASGADVTATYICGSDAYATIDLSGGNLRTIVKPKGSAGTSDPLDQISTVGWKVGGFVAKILNQSWLVRVESAIST